MWTLWVEFGNHHLASHSHREGSLLLTQGASTSRVCSHLSMASSHLSSSSSHSRSSRGIVSRQVALITSWQGGEEVEMGQLAVAGLVEEDLLHSSLYSLYNLQLARHSSPPGSQPASPTQVPQNGGGGVRPDPVPGPRPNVREVAGVVDGEQVLLADMIDPVVPGPHPEPVIEDAEGWNLIDLWGVWDCMLCEFPTMQNIPRIYREVWASAMGKIMRVIEREEEGIELERGLKWLLIIPKAIFRQGRRGGKAGKGLIARRVNLLIRGDWGGLLTLLDRDCQLAKVEKERQVRGQERVREDVQLERDRKNALLLLSKGHISKAARIINSHGSSTGLPTI